MSGSRHTYKVDFHTHSEASPDGALTEADYRKMLESGQLDYIAVTDHNTAEFALGLQKKLGDKLGGRIIVGEEIRTSKGEIIGLYLQKTIPKMLSPRETVNAIREQGGLVCIPHPFENVRRGMQIQDLDEIADEIDMMEVHNGRAVFQNKSKAAYAWVAAHNSLGIANSDSHAVPGWGKTYTILRDAPTKTTLVGLLADAGYQVGFPGVKAVLYPKINKLKTRYNHYIRQNHHDPHPS
jgi:predicted metal-dependent phosphoesterase TrpH